MNVLIKSLDIKKVVLYFCFLTITLFSNVSYGEEMSLDSDRRKIQAAPTVIKTIPNQIAQEGVPFNLDVNTLAIFSDADSDDLTLTIKQADDSDLPAWLTAEEKLPPALVGSFDTSGDACGVAVAGNYAYVGDGWSGLKIINISNPSNLTLVGSLGTLYRSREVVVIENYAYVADDDDGLRIVDISNPSSPILVGSLDTNDAYGVAVVGNLAYVAVWDAGLQIIDISTPSSPSLVGTYNTLGYALGVAVVGNYAYVADYDAGLQIIDISTTSSPSLVGTYDTPHYAYGVTVVDNYAYVADCSAGLQIIDVSTPSSPSLVGSLDTTGDAYGVAVVGNYAYVADRSAGLQIIDISTPSSPSLVGTCDTDDAWGVAVVGNYAYVADMGAGLKIIEGTEAGLTLSGTPSASDLGTLNLKVTASDGTNEVSTTFSINVQSGPPTVSDISKSISKNSVMTFSSTDFTSQFSGGSGGLAKIQIMSLPSNGDLKLSGSDVTLNQEINVGDLGNLTFEPDTDWYGNTSFLWKGSDGVEYSSNSANVNLTVSDGPPNSIPVISDIAKSISKNSVMTFSATDFTSHFSDGDGDDLTKIQVMSLPSNGDLKLSGSDVTLNQEISVGDLGNLTFEPDTDWYGNTSFLWKGSDGIEYSSNSANVNLTIRDGLPNNIPVISDIHKSGHQYDNVKFSQDDFIDAFYDADGDPLVNIKIVGLPNAHYGELRLNGVQAAKDQIVPITDIDDDLVFETNNELGKLSFGWQGSDGLDYSNTESVIIEIGKPKSSTSTPTWVWPTVLSVTGGALCTVVTGVFLLYYKDSCFKKSRPISIRLSNVEGAVKVDYDSDSD